MPRTAGLAAVFSVCLALAGPAAWGHGEKRHAGTDQAVTISAPAPNVGSGGAPLPIEVGGPFELIDQTGRSVTDKDFLGRHMLVFFGYANCPGICPTALRAMVDAVDELGDAGARIAPILITVDAENDRPKELAAAVAKIHPRLTGLTGTPEQLAAAAAAYGVTSAPAGRSWNGIDMFQHGPFVYLMGPDGKLLTLFPPILDGPAMATAILGYLG